LVGQHRFDALAAEASVVLELGHPRDRLDHLRVGDADAEAVGLVAHERVVDQLVERLRAEIERLQQLGRDALVALLHRDAQPVDVPAADALPVDARDDVDPLAADRTDAPDDEETGEEAVEDLDADGVGVLAEETKHPVPAVEASRAPRALQTSMRSTATAWRRLAPATVFIAACR